MITKLKELKDSEKELTVELDKVELKEYLEKAGKVLSRAFQIDGFRSGKVPLEVLRQKIGDKKILEEALEFAVTDSLAKALRQEKVEIVSSSNLKIIINTPESLKYSIELLSFPEVELGVYKDLKIAKKEVKVAEEDVNQALEQILKSRAVLKDSDNPAQKGNHIEVDFEVTAGGKAVEGGKSQNHPFTLGEGNFIPGFEDALVGLKKEESREFSLVAPADYYQKEIAGKKLDFKVTVKAVKTKTLPPLDDEFAKSLGRFQSLDELKKNVSEALKLEKEQKEAERVRLEILEKISGQTKVEIPAKLLNQQLDGMVANFDRSLHERGMELGLYLAHIKKTQEDLRKEWVGQAEKQIKQALILKEVGRKENIKVSDEEAEEAATALLSQTMVPAGEKPQLDLEQIKQRAGDAIWRQKVFEFLEKENN